MEATNSSNLLIIALFGSILAIFGAGWCLWQIRKINNSRKNLFGNQTEGDLETALVYLTKKIQNLEQGNLAHTAEIQNIVDALKLTVQKVGVVRYSPFNDGGGNYSFSLALLNAHDSGVVITNMYGRQQSRVYTKRLEKGKSELPLTEEEMRAVSLANQKN
jgi:hypothetical protein